MATAIKTFVLVFGIYGHGPPSVIPDYGTYAECQQARIMVLTMKGWRLRTVHPWSGEGELRMADAGYRAHALDGSTGAE